MEYYQKQSREGNLVNTDRVYIEHRNAGYPEPTYGYAPSQKYPEYAWDDISTKK